MSSARMVQQVLPGATPPLAEAVGSKRAREAAGDEEPAGAGFSTPRARERTQHFRALQQLSVGGERVAKLFFDPVHGTMSFEEVCLRIIDTPQFQRLRGVKQLGACDYVFPGACHTRFEHSIGTGHLAGRMAAHLRQTQPYLGLTSIDVLCAKIAGLCHDLGHGPFSHVFDGVFMPRLGFDPTWAHEQASIDMFKFLLRDNGISLAYYGLSEADELLIEEMIIGTPEAERRGRGRDKMFLYDIVSNVRSGLDVDKLDYFQRDARYTGMDAKCDFSRIMELARVANVVEDGETRRHICYPEKLVKEVFSVFRTRFDLHQAVYTHKVVKAIEFMIVDILVMANDALLVLGANGQRYRMSEAYKDMEAYARLKDSVLDFIDLSVDERLAEAQALLRRLRTRDVYQCVGQSPVPLYASADDGDEWYNRSEADLAIEITANAPAEDELLPEHVIAELMHIHHGKRQHNPVDRVRFFAKEALLQPNAEIFAEQIDETKYASLLPRTFEDRALRLFVRRADKAEVARQAFERWCERNQCPSPFPSLSQSQ